MLLRCFVFLALLGCSGISAQEYRPQYHFSPRVNWTNDPNGLVYFEGEYHLFYQYNPFGNEWGHMSWGHAVSRDLLGWEQLPVAIPEGNGVMIFTGSTVIDEGNTSGFCTGGKPCLVAVYTGHTPESAGKPALQTQNLAYSNDRGRTWTKYNSNPVLDLKMPDFRDPKVIWSAQSKRWVMAVSLPNEHKVRLYGSPDLKTWKALSEFGPEGATGGQWECPELFEAPVDGHAGETRWVMKVGLNPGGRLGGSGEQYFVGRFDGTKFTNDNPPSLTLWTDYGKDCYCALTFNGMPRGEKPVMIGWMDNWQYASKLPTSPWRGQMTVPRALSLRETPEGIRLFQTPVAAVNAAAKENFDAPRAMTPELGKKITASEATRSRSFELGIEMDLGKAQDVGVKLLADKSSYTLIGYDQSKKVLYIDRTHSGLTNFSKEFSGRMETPLDLGAAALNMNILVDRCSVEVFANGGLVTSTNLVFPLQGANQVEFYSHDGESGAVKACVRPIRSIHLQ